jgi:hypothetical protein
MQIMSHETQRKAYIQYIRHERRTGFAGGFGMLAAGLIGAGAELYYSYSVLPNQINKITTEIQASNNAPSKSAVKVAQHRLKSNDCDSHPCTEQERQDDRHLIWRDGQIKAEITDRTGYLENRKLVLPFAFLGFLGLSALGVLVAGATDVNLSKPWDYDEY